MEQLRTIITTACLLSIAVGLCSLLRPARQFDKQLRFLISLLFVIGIAAPFLRIDWRMPPSAFAQVQQSEQTQTLSEETEQLILTQTEQKTESTLQAFLTENGIVCSDLHVAVHIDETKRIYISEVSTECSDRQRACELLRTQLGEEVTLHVSEMAQ